MRIKVHTALCSGHARCAAFGPDVYWLDEQGYNEIHVADIPPELEEQAVRGAMACPEMAIVMIDPPSWFTPNNWRKPVDPVLPASGAAETHDR